MINEKGFDMMGYGGGMLLWPVLLALFAAFIIPRFNSETQHSVC